MTDSKSDTRVYSFGRRPIEGTILKTLLQSYHASLTRFTRPLTCRRRLAQRPCAVLIVDLAGQETEALTLIAQARGIIPRITTVALVARGDVRHAVEAIRTGACECLEKPVAADRFREVIRIQLDRVTTATAGPDRILMAKEKQVFQRVLAGQTSGEIATELRCSRRTVETHRRNMMRKLNVRCLADLFRQASPS